MFCPNCGSNISENSHFCPNCGMQFGEQDQHRNQNQFREQPKTGLGIPVGLMAAIIWLSALISPAVLAVLVLYVLYAEKDKWLKAAAVKATAVYLVFFLAFQVIEVLTMISGGFNCLFNRWFLLGWTAGVPMVITNLLQIAKIVFFLAGGIQALKMKEIRIRKIDEFVEKYL